MLVFCVLWLCYRSVIDGRQRRAGWPFRQRMQVSGTQTNKQHKRKIYWLFLAFPSWPALFLLFASCLSLIITPLANFPKKTKKKQKVVAAGREKLHLMPEFYTYALRIRSISLRSVVQLKSQLRSCTRHWLSAFMQTGGLSSLLEMLRRWDDTYAPLINCFLSGCWVVCVFVVLVCFGCFWVVADCVVWQSGQKSDTTILTHLLPAGTVCAALCSTRYFTHVTYSVTVIVVVVVVVVVVMLFHIIVFRNCILHLWSFLIALYYIWL